MVYISYLCVYIVCLQETFRYYHQERCTTPYSRTRKQRPITNKISLMFTSIECWCETRYYVICSSCLIQCLWSLQSCNNIHCSYVTIFKPDYLSQNIVYNWDRSQLNQIIYHKDTPYNWPTELKMWATVQSSDIDSDCRTCTPQCHTVTV